MPVSSLRRGLELLRILGAHHAPSIRLKDLAQLAGGSQSSVHRALADLVALGYVEQAEGQKRYRLGLELFVLAAKAHHGTTLRDLARPVVLRLSAALNDTVFLLVRDRFDAVCLDRVEGPFPIRSFTGDIGGRVPLGLGQGSLAILAHLPEAERDMIVHYNAPRFLDRGFLDEVGVRSAMESARAQGWVNLNTGLIQGMAGVAVPVFDASGQVAAALSVGTLQQRLGPDRLPAVVRALQAEAQALAPRINPFDPTLRMPARAFAGDATVRNR